MNIYIYTVEGINPNNCVGVLDTYTSFNFTKKFQSAGSFTIKGNYIPKVRQMLKAGNLIYVNPQVCGIIHSVNYDVDKKGNLSYTVYGSELKSILGYRIVWDTYNHKLPAADWINGIVQENTQGSRKLFKAHLKPAIDCPVLDKQVSYSNLLDTVSKACAASTTTKGLMLGFDITCDIDNGFTFSLLEGANRTWESPEPFMVSRDMDNVSSLSYAESSKKTVNVIKCGGEGEGTERRFEIGGDTTLSGLARKESFKDSKNLQSSYRDAQGNEQTLSEEEYRKLLQQAANDALKEDSISVDAESIVSTSTALELLGAKVTLIDKTFGVRVDDFITEINWIDESDGGLTTLTIGDGIDAQRLIV